MLVDFLGLKGDYACTLEWDSPEAQELWEAGYTVRKTQAAESSAASSKHPDETRRHCAFPRIEIETNLEVGDYE